VSEARTRAHQGLDRLLIDKARAQLLLRLLEQVAAAVRRALTLGEQAGQAIEQRPIERRRRLGWGVLEHRGIGNRHGRPSVSVPRAGSTSAPRVRSARPAPYAPTARTVNDLS